MWEKLKYFIQDETSFYAVLIILVAVVSFGLGRTSIVAQNTASLPANIVMSQFEVPEPATVSEGVVGSKNSDKYHLPTCPGALNISEANRISFPSREAAEAAGYTPAGNCF